MSNVPIADYALLSDCRSAAPVLLTSSALLASMDHRSLLAYWMLKQDIGPSRQLVPRK